jgi:hypothetical protein
MNINCSQAGGISCTGGKCHVLETAALLTLISMSTNDGHVDVSMTIVRQQLNWHRKLGGDDWVAATESCAAQHVPEHGQNELQC